MGLRSKVDPQFGIKLPYTVKKDLPQWRPLRDQLRKKKSKKEGKDILGGFSLKAAFSR
jgi:hypothetical protein